MRYAIKSVRNIFFPTHPKFDIRKSIGIELSSICNAKCIFCNYRLGFRKKKFMKLDEFKSIAKSCVNLGFENLGLTSMGGELFTHPDAIKIIKEGKSSGFKHISAFTNGIAIHKYNISDLLNSGIDAILISFPGFNQEVYKEIFQVNKYDNFIQSIKELLETHRKSNSRVAIVFEPRTYLTERQIKESDFYIFFVKKYLSEHVVMREPLRVYDTWGETIKETDLIKGMKIDKNHLKSIWPLKKPHLCFMLLGIGICANGDVRLCNCRYDETIETEYDTLTIANMNNYVDLEHLMAENKDKIKNILDAFVHGKLPELCKKCSFYVPVSKKYKESCFMCHIMNKN